MKTDSRIFRDVSKIPTSELIRGVSKGLPYVVIIAAWAGACFAIAVLRGNRSVDRSDLEPWQLSLIGSVLSAFLLFFLFAVRRTCHIIEDRVKDRHDEERPELKRSSHDGGWIAFSIGFALGASILFSTLFGISQGWGAQTWLSEDYWRVELIILLLFVVPSFGIFAWNKINTTISSRKAHRMIASQSTPISLRFSRPAFSDGMFFGLVFPLLLFVMILSMTGLYVWLTEGNLFLLFK